MTQPRVFIVQKPYQTRDFSSASRYGAIHYIFDSEDSPSLTPAKAKFKIMQKLKDFNPDEDYIVISGGDPIIGLLVGSILHTLGIRNYTYLRWERERNLNGERNSNGRLTAAGFYVPVDIDLKQF